MTFSRKLGEALEGWDIENEDEYDRQVGECTTQIMSDVARFFHSLGDVNDEDFLPTPVDNEFSFDLPGFPSIIHVQYHIGENVEFNEPRVIDFGVQSAQSVIVGRILFAIELLESPTDAIDNLEHEIRGALDHELGHLYKPEIVQADTRPDTYDPAEYIKLPREWYANVFRLVRLYQRMRRQGVPVTYSSLVSASHDDRLVRSFRDDLQFRRSLIRALVRAGINLPS